ncbi:uncharacterized protein LOC143019495 [Oratosquilla oratoria]|uniref:uncharacterized protein LOC143019495 n=1 Tax=Oratosquilla oratoria TaxID=337810 RepID=UPI003F775FDA
MSYDYMAAASGYGGYEKTIDCNSALGLLGLLGLIELLRDIIEQITTQRRRKRDAEDPFSSPLDNMVQRVTGGAGLPSLHTNLPGVLLPLIHHMMDAHDGTEDGRCLPRSLCEANHLLTKNYGALGSFLATLLSEVMAKAFSGHVEETYLKATWASRQGRLGMDCSAAVSSECDLLHPKYRPHNNLTLVEDEMEADISSSHFKDSDFERFWKDPGFNLQDL